MKFTLGKTVAAALWISALSAAGIIAGASSASSWLVLATVGIVPPVLLMRHFNATRQTMAESIGEVLR